jgi:hypothetical protein
MSVRSPPGCALSPPDVGCPYPERAIRRRCLAGHADVRAGPLACPCVDLAFGAVGPRHLDRDRDVAVVLDVQALELAAPLVRRVLDRLTFHTNSVEHMFV